MNRGSGGDQEVRDQMLGYPKLGHQDVRYQEAGDQEPRYKEPGYQEKSRALLGELLSK